MIPYPLWRHTRRYATCEGWNRHSVVLDRDREGIPFPDRGRGQRANRLGARREDLHDRQRREHEAPVEGEAREQAARDAQPVRAARGRGRNDCARRAGARRRRRRVGRSLRHRRRDGQRDLASSVRQHAGEPRRHERYAVPRRPDRRAHDGRSLAGDIHHLRGVVGRTSSPGEPRGRQGRCSSREIHPRAAASPTP